MATPARHRVVIVGGGFGGLFAGSLHELSSAPAAPERPPVAS